ncbi:hypothetical protein [Hymenobacter metallilatus]|uniref:Uncharacterized protein n=1 Tax=Hymenobacter metallilatus TaxID=2493666 RepID=A0A428JJY8_9BACT|nr:hypothetical protein [Hymenobacter metallilatus]RSK33067.1 hypothetical protein EI290_10140 [Hymenobacter metallilatus]
MLDFYFIADEKPSNYSPALEYAGGIENREFEQAQQARVIEDYLIFFDDFRWSNAQVHQKLLQLHSIKSEQVDALRKILQRAAQLHYGVIAFGD